MQHITITMQQDELFPVVDDRKVERDKISQMFDLLKKQLERESEQEQHDE